MKFKPLPALQYLRESLRYEDGCLYWLFRPRKHFRDIKTWKQWNSRYSGTEAFTAQTNSGHKFGSFGNEHYMAHRVIWKLLSGQEPVGLIDHKDRNPENNKFENLRPATKSQNNMNSNFLRGVYFDKSRNNWQAYIKQNGKKIHLGRHISEAQARQARVDAEVRLFGEFAP